MGHNDGRIGTLVHAADLHIGAPLKGVANRFPEDEQHLANYFRQEVSEAFDNLINITIEENADILVLAGDIYDGIEQEFSAQNKFSKGLSKLVGAGVRVFIVHGNHDPLISELRKDVELPPEVTVFDNKSKADLHTVELRSGVEIQVAGMSFKKKEESRNLVQEFFNNEKLKPKNPGTTIGVLHTNVGSAGGHGNYAPCSVQDLQDSPIGYWALGHIHKRRIERLEEGNNRRWWAYSGNLQGASPKPSECEPKGCLVVNIFADGFGEPVFRPCDTVRFGLLQVDLSELREEEEINSRIEGKISDEIESFQRDNANEKPTIMSIELNGATKAWGSIPRTETELIDWVRGIIGGNSKDCAIIKAKNQVSPAADLEQLQNREDLQGNLFRAVDELRIEDLISQIRDEGLDNPAQRKTLDSLLETDSIFAFQQIHDQVRNLLLREWENQQNAQAGHG